ncbi:hypothetical protein ACIRPK_36085 [Kitasatospora sp. NPDC101801]|uniref:hypothetical protein n=1 Tax=Kitasatospora sp. NPDC101801 TaxID=3364103 RepID=UPI00382E573B
MHPTRGMVRCPAAPALAAALNGSGITVATGAVEPRPGGAGVLVATTYLDLNGQPVGVAVAAGRAHTALAYETVGAWSAVLRTRRVLVASGAPCCVGAAAVLPGAREPVPAQGLRKPAGARAGGAGCPRSQAAWALVLAFQQRGDTVLLVGGPEDAAAPGPSGRDPLPAEAWSRIVQVGTVDQAAALTVPDPRRLSFVVRPCVLVDWASQVVNALRERFAALRGQHPDQWCYERSDLHRGARLAAESSDLVLTVGGSGALAPSLERARHLTGLAQLDLPSLGAAATVAVIEEQPPAPTAHPALAAADVVEVLSGLGPLSVVRHRVATEVSTDVYRDQPGTVTLTGARSRS